LEQQFTVTTYEFDVSLFFFTTVSLNSTALFSPGVLALQLAQYAVVHHPRTLYVASDSQWDSTQLPSSSLASEVLYKLYFENHSVYMRETRRIAFLEVARIEGGLDISGGVRMLAFHPLLPRHSVPATYFVYVRDSS
jgi:hypothetical protein